MHKITGNTSGTMSMASGTTLVLGLPSSSTLPGFPSNFTRANISLNAASTVVYQANNTSSGQTVSATPYYGNLLVTTSSAGTSGSSPFFVRGNFNVSGSITFKQNVDIDTIYGTLTIASGTTYRSYGESEYLYGNLTANGAYSGTSGGTCYMYGNTNQIISGPVNNPINIAFNQFIVEPKSGNDTTFIEANISAISTIDNSGTIFVPAAYNDTIEVLANINNYGTFTALNGVCYFKAGSSIEDVNINPVTFYKLTTNTGFYLYCNAIVKSDYTHMSGVIVHDPGNLYVGGNFINNSSAAQSEIVFMNGSHNQYIQGSVAPEFADLEMKQAAATDTVFLSTAITVDHVLSDSGGVFDCQTYQVTGNTSSTFTMANNTGLVLGQASSSTNVSFPTLYTTAHTTLNAGSTVSYLANTAQTISTTPTYGNLVLGSGSSSTRKTPASSTLAVAGNLNVNANTTLVENTGTLNLTGNLTNADTVLFTTGAMNIGGTFTNNGYYAYGTGTATFNGSANAQVNGSIAPEFYNLTLNTSATTDTLFLTHPVTVSNTLTLTKGLLDCLGSQLTNSSLPTISISPSTATICAGSSTTLTASGYSSYVWAPSSSLSASTGTSVTASPLGTVTYTVYGNTSNSYECAASTSSTGKVTVNYCEESCSTAISISSGRYDAIPINHKNMWFSFTASGNSANIIFHNPPDTLHGRIIMAILYSGTCSMLDSLGYDSISPKDPNQVDSLLIFKTTGLVSGNTYYIKAISDDSTTSRTIDLALHKFTSYCPAAPTCDLVSNGNFESCTNITCPTYWSGLADCWVAEPSSKFDKGTPDYFNSCDNYQGPYSFGLPSNACNSNSGSGITYTNNHTPGYTTTGGYAGIICHSPPQTGQPEYEEYLQENLSNSMVSGVVYNVSFWANLSIRSSCYNDPSSLGIYISSCAPYNGYPLMDCAGNSIPVSDAGQLITAASCGHVLSANNTWVQISGNYTAIGGEDYITIGNFNGNALGTYTPTNGGSGTGIGDYYYIDDVSITHTINVTTSSNPTCTSNGTASASVTNAISPITYSWAPGGATTSSVTGLSSGTYTVTVTDATGCAATQTVVVAVLPTPTITVSGPTTVCPSIGTILNASGSGTYTWSPSLGLSSTTGATVTATPTTNPTTTYVVTQSSNGCSASVVINYESNCCTPADSAHDWANETIPPNTYTTNLPIVITGTVTINNTVTFSGCPDMRMDAGSEIIVLPGGTLNIDNSRLWGPCDMWDGIVVEETTSGTAGQLYVSNGSIIEDADTAIYAPPTSTYTPPTISVINSYLRNNYYDIYINGYTSTTTNYPFTLQGTFLTTGTDGSFSGPTLKAPNTSKITHEGIRINNVNKYPVIIGTAGSNSYTNLFSNMDYGVYDSNANCEVYNNEFSELLGRPFSTCRLCPTLPAIGVAILAKANPFAAGTAADYYGLYVGGSASYEANTFHNVYAGVNVTNYIKTCIYNNIFTNDYDQISGIGAKPIGIQAVYAAVGQTTAMEVDSNIITNFNTGIQLERTLGHGPTNSVNDVNYNIISVNTSTVTPYNPTGTSSSMNIGIKVENTQQSAFAPTRIFANTVHNANNCIWISNINNSKVSILHPQESLIDSNKDIRVAGLKGITGAENSGIRVEDCYGNFNSNIIVQDNNMIYASNTYTLTPTAPSDTEVIGINVLHSQNVYEYCNNIDSIGECMRFTGNCTNQRVYDNVFDEYGPSYDGLVLWTNAQIGPQGIPTSQTMGDIWYNSLSFLRSETFTDQAANVYPNSILYVNSSSPYNPGLYPLLNGAIPGSNKYSPIGGSLVTTAYSALSCPTSCSSCTNSHSPVIDSMVMDSMHYPMYAPYAYRMDEQFVFDSIAADTSVMTGDTVLRKFYNANISTNIGALSTINTYINTGYTTEAASALSSFTPADTIEANYKTVDSIYVYYIGLGVYTVDSADLVHLYNIAYQCPQMGGMAVYEARAMLNLVTQSDWEFSDSCTTSGGRRGHIHQSPPVNANQITPISNLSAKVYPNPANSTLNVEVTLPAGKVYQVCIYNSIGEKVVCEELEQNITSFSTNNLAQGIYYYRITSENGSLVRADKVMIVH